MNKVIKRDQLVAALDSIAAKYQLIAPVQDESSVLFKPGVAGKDVVLDAVNSTVSPKGTFFPQWETMYTYNMAEADFAVKHPDQGPDRVLFGVRPCDIMAILHIDPVFIGEKFGDFYYEAKRNKTTIIGVSCPSVAHTCFCSTFGGSPTANKGADIMFYDLGDKFAVEVLTDKGKAVAELISKFLTDDAAAPAAVEAKAKELAAQCKPVDVTGVKEFLDGAFEHPYWVELSKKCLNCGVCTYVCPTCHCFDVVDEGYKSEGQRIRCWDSCMAKDFNLAAGGHNTRPSKLEKVRNRFMHKLKYHLDRYNLAGCIGCGRCSQKCPVNLDITQVISDVKAVK
ncbi:MAG: 4Fe-4S dicluster domain-containing protein [Clostridia bacterium]|nr:4Fe-4S dicluster domain-containing protein [Clostridia bacterium]